MNVTLPPNPYQAARKLFGKHATIGQLASGWHVGAITAWRKTPKAITFDVTIYGRGNSQASALYDAVARLDAHHVAPPHPKVCKLCKTIKELETKTSKYPLLRVRELKGEN